MFALILIGLMSGHVCTEQHITLSMTVPHDFFVTADCSIEQSLINPNAYRTVCPLAMPAVWDATGGWWDAIEQHWTKWIECGGEPE